MTNEHSQSLYELREIYLQQQKQHENAINDLRLQIMQIDSLLSYAANNSVTPLDVSVIDSDDKQSSSTAEKNYLNNHSANKQLPPTRVEEDIDTPPRNTLDALPRFRNMTQPDAFLKIFTENVGIALDLDYLVRAYYGRITNNLMKAAKGRVSSVMTIGTKQGLWDKVPRSLGYYTLDKKKLDD